MFISNDYFFSMNCKKRNLSDSCCSCLSLCWFHHYCLSSCVFAVRLCSMNLPDGKQIDGSPPVQHLLMRSQGIEIVTSLGYEPQVSSEKLAHESVTIFFFAHLRTKIFRWLWESRKSPKPWFWDLLSITALVIFGFSLHFEVKTTFESRGSNKNLSHSLCVQSSLLVRWRLYCAASKRQKRSLLQNLLHSLYSTVRRNFQTMSEMSQESKNA